MGMTDKLLSAGWHVVGDRWYAPTSEPYAYTLRAAALEQRLRAKRVPPHKPPRDLRRELQEAKL
jgi:hypothetical protein